MNTTAKDMADQLINRAKNMQTFIVERDMDSIVFDGKPIKYNMTHVLGGPMKIHVPAMSQEEAEQQVNDWLDNQRDAA
jgi:hypothetical protein